MKISLFDRLMELTQMFNFQDIKCKENKVQ